MLTWKYVCYLRCIIFSSHNFLVEMTNFHVILTEECGDARTSHDICFCCVHTPTQLHNIRSTCLQCIATSKKRGRITIATSSTLSLGSNSMAPPTNSSHSPTICTLLLPPTNSSNPPSSTTQTLPTMGHPLLHD